MTGIIYVYFKKLQKILSSIMKEEYLYALFQIALKSSEKRLYQYRIFFLNKYLQKKSYETMPWEFIKKPFNLKVSTFVNVIR